MTTEFRPDETITVGASDLTEIDGTPVVSGATVVLTIADDLTRLVESTTTLTVPSDGNDWLGELTTPSIPGVYTVKVEAIRSDKVWRATQDITVLPF